MAGVFLFQPLVSFAQVEEELPPTDDTEEVSQIPVEESTPAPEEETPLEYSLSVTSSVERLTVPAKVSDLGPSTTTITAKLVDGEGNAVPEAKITFTSGNKYFPDYSGFFKGATEAMTDTNGEATATYVADAPEDPVDIHASFETNESGNLEDRKAIYSSVTVYKDNPETNRDIEEAVTKSTEPAPAPATGATIPSKDELKELKEDLVETSANNPGEMEVKIYSELEAYDNSNGKNEVEIRTVIHTAYSESLVDRKDPQTNELIPPDSSGPPTLGFPILTFTSTASDGSEKAALLGKTELPNAISWTETKTKSAKNDEGAQVPIVRTHLSTQTLTNKITLNPRIVGNRDLEIKVDLVARGVLVADKLTREANPGAFKNDPLSKFEILNPEEQGNFKNYRLGNQSLTFKQSNAAPEFTLDFESNQKKLAEGTNSLKVFGKLSETYPKDIARPRSGKMKLTVTSSDDLTGKLDQEQVEISTNGIFSVNYTAPEAGSRTLTLSGEVINVDEEGRDQGTVTASVVVEQVGKVEEEATESKLLLAQGTDGNRTLKIYGTRKSVVMGPVRARTSQCFEAISSCREFGTKINDLASSPFAADSEDSPYYVLITAEVTDTKGVVTTGNVRGATKGKAKFAPAFAGSGVKDEYFYKADDGMDVAIDSSSGNSAFYFAVGQARQRFDQYTPGDNFKLAFNHSYNSAGKAGNVAAEATIDLIKSLSEANSQDNARISIQVTDPPAWKDAASDQRAYTRLITRLRSGESLSAAEKSLIEDQIAWKVNVKVSAPKEGKLNSGIGVSSQPAGQFIMTSDKEGQKFFMEEKDGDLFKPQPLPAYFPGDGKSLIPGYGGATLVNGEATFGFVPEQTPDKLKSILTVSYGDKDGTYEKQYVLHRPNETIELKGDGKEEAEASEILSDQEHKNTGIKFSMRFPNDIADADQNVSGELKVIIPKKVAVTQDLKNSPALIFKIYYGGNGSATYFTGIGGAIDITPGKTIEFPIYSGKLRVMHEASSGDLEVTQVIKVTKGSDPTDAIDASVMFAHGATAKGCDGDDIHIGCDEKNGLRKILVPILQSTGLQGYTTLKAQALIALTGEPKPTQPGDGSDVTNEDKVTDEEEKETEEDPKEEPKEEEPKDEEEPNDGIDYSKPLSNLDYSARINNLKNLINSSTYLSAEQKQEANTKLDQMKSDPANWDDFYPRIDSILRNAIRSPHDSQAEQLLKAWANLGLDFLNGDLRHNDKISERERQKFDQLAERTKNGDRKAYYEISRMNGFRWGTYIHVKSAFDNLGFKPDSSRPQDTSNNSNGSGSAGMMNSISAKINSLVTDFVTIGGAAAGVGGDNPVLINLWQIIKNFFTR